MYRTDSQADGYDFWTKNVMSIIHRNVMVVCEEDTGRSPQDNQRNNQGSHRTMGMDPQSSTCLLFPLPLSQACNPIDSCDCMGIAYRYVLQRVLLTIERVFIFTENKFQLE